MTTAVVTFASAVCAEVVRLVAERDPAGYARLPQAWGSLLIPVAARATVQYGIGYIAEVPMRASIVFLVAASAALAQEGPRFEVASVKPHSAEGGMNKMPLAMMRAMAARTCVLSKNTPGRWRADGMSLSLLVACAYGVKPFQVTAPSWMDSETYDIVVKLPTDVDEAQFRLMMQNLLVERFHLVAHQDSKEMQTYRLTAPKGAAKLTPASQTPPNPDMNDPEKREAALKAMMEQMKALAMARGQAGGGGSSRSFSSPKATMGSLAQTLTGYLDGPVTDETGIEGEYSIHLSWNPDTDGSGPSIAEAVQQQLGLKLDRQKGPVPIVVVDRADKVPVEN